jgi:hypothetical protein
MSARVGILSAIVMLAVIGLVTIERRSQVRLRAEVASLHQELYQLSRVSAENLRLSNVVAQARIAQAGANEQYQELLRLRSEVSRLRQEDQESNRVSQVQLYQNVSDQMRELAALRNDVRELGDEISSLREAIQEIYTDDSAPVSTERSTAQTSRSREEQAVPIRMINTRGPLFAEKLKRSAAAEDGETFQEVFGRYLQGNGVDLSNVVGLVYDDRTGRVIVRAPQATLDVIEKLTVALDAQ